MAPEMIGQKRCLLKGEVVERPRAQTGRVDQTGQANRVFEVRGSPNRGADSVTELRVDFGDVRRRGNREGRRRSSLNGLPSRGSRR